MKGVNLRIMKCFLNLERKTKRIYKEGLVVIVTILWVGKRCHERKGRTKDEQKETLIHEKDVA